MLFRHFREEDIDRTSISCVRIRENAVPAIFPAFPSYLQKPQKQRQRPPPRARPSATAASGLSEQPADTATEEARQQQASTSAAKDTLSDTPRKQALKHKLNCAEEKLSSSRKRVKVLMQARRRLLKKNAALKEVIGELRKQRLVEHDSLAMLEKAACGVGDLLKRQAAKAEGKSLPVSYSPELRSFALTLHFYSPHAYKYVRKMFDTCLSHPRTIEKWYSSVDGTPGFTEAAFQALKARAAARCQPLVCALMMDEIAIRQQVEWDGKKLRGYVDYGTGIDDDGVHVAREALTLLVVGINHSFKIPVGYFLIDGLNGTGRANLIVQCLKKLHEAGVVIVSLSFDGEASNFSMATNLGCNFEWNLNFKTSFSHPVTQEPVHIFLDPCHMLKLVRGTFAERKSMVDCDGEFIDYRFVERLHHLQTTEGLHLGNKLRSAHMQWFKKKMNVKLAAQLLSESVAKSLQFCREENLPGFEGCEPTMQSI